MRRPIDAKIIVLDLTDILSKRLSQRTLNFWLENEHFVNNFANDFVNKPPKPPIDDINDVTHFVNVFVKFNFKFLNCNKDTLLDPDLVNDIPKPPKPFGDEIVKITKLSNKMRTK